MTLDFLPARAGILSLFVLVPSLAPGSHANTPGQSSVPVLVELFNSPLTADLRLDESWRRDRLKVVAFVQERRSRAVPASAAVPVPPR